VPALTLRSRHPRRGVDRVFAIGGAQAVAAMAYGTESVPKRTKLCRPAATSSSMLAKKQVFSGSVGIDGPAGPERGGHYRR